MEITAKMNSPTCFEYLQYSRTLIAIYIKSGEFSKAEKLLEETEFSYLERTLLQAGISFTSGKVDKAIKSLQSYRHVVPPKTPTILSSVPSGIKPSYSSSHLLPDDIIPSNPMSANATRRQSRAASMSKMDSNTNINANSSVPVLKPANSHLDPSSLSMNDEFEYGDEHINIMENSLPTFMQEMETMLGHVLVSIFLSISLYFYSCSLIVL